MKLLSKHFKSWESEPSRTGHSFQGFQTLTNGHFFKPQLTKWGRLGKSGCNRNCRGENPLLAIEAECSQLPAPKWLIEFERTVKDHSQSSCLSLKRGEATVGKQTQRTLFFTAEPQKMHLKSLGKPIYGSISNITLSAVGCAVSSANWVKLKGHPSPCLKGLQGTTHGGKANNWPPDAVLLRDTHWQLLSVC